MPTPDDLGDPVDDELLTPSEARAILKISRQTLWRYGAQGVLRPVRFGTRTLRYPRSQIRALMAEAQA